MWLLFIYFNLSPAVIPLANPIHKYQPFEEKIKASSYIAQYPILRIIQSALHFTSLADLLNQTPSQLLWEASSHKLQLMREDRLLVHISTT